MHHQEPLAHLTPAILAQGSDAIDQHVRQSRHQRVSPYQLFLAPNGSLKFRVDPGFSAQCPFDFFPACRPPLGYLLVVVLV